MSLHQLGEGDFTSTGNGLHQVIIAGDVSGPGKSLSPQSTSVQDGRFMSKQKSCALFVQYLNLPPFSGKIATTDGNEI
jgi:hypothetical protein